MSTAKQRAAIAASIEHRVEEAFHSPKPARAVSELEHEPSRERWFAMAALGLSVWNSHRSMTFKRFSKSKKLLEVWFNLVEPLLKTTPARGVSSKGLYGYAALTVFCLAERDDSRFDHALAWARTTPNWSENIEKALAESLSSTARRKGFAASFKVSPKTEFMNRCYAGDWKGLAAILAQYEPPNDTTLVYALCSLTHNVTPATFSRPFETTTFLRVARPVFEAKRKWSERCTGGVARDTLANAYALTTVAAAALKDGALVDVMTEQLLRDARQLGDWCDDVSRRVRAAGFQAAADRLEAKFGSP